MKSADPLFVEPAAKPPSRSGFGQRVEIIDKFHFEIVRGCQLRCVGCPNSTLQPKVQRIAVDDFDRFLHQVDVRHVGYLRLFNFGEPLLHKDLAGVLSQIPKQNWSVGRVEISTNGQFADWEQIAEAFKTGVLGQLVVSCDGDGTAESYERLRPPSKWDKLIEFLERTKELRDRHQPDLPLITRTICPDPQQQARWKSVLEPRGWQPEFRDWLYLPESEQNMTGRDPEVPATICSFQAAADRLYVDWDGTVVPCCVHPRAGTMGNLASQTYNEIMAGPMRAAFVRTMAGHRKRMPICNACSF
jgi:radical SAM protein with 4Fe4S-binding SPASM domain